MQAVVPTIASAALPPSFSRSIPMRLQISLSEATAPNSPTPNAGGEGVLEEHGSLLDMGFANAVCKISRPVSHRFIVAAAIVPGTVSVNGKESLRSSRGCGECLPNPDRLTSMACNQPPGAHPRQPPIGKSPIGKPLNECGRSNCAGNTVGGRKQPRAR